MSGSLNRLGKFTTILLVVVIVCGGVMLISKTISQAPSIEILISQIPALTEQISSIYVSGALASPGIYSLRSGDTIEDIIQAAGGITPEADPNHLIIYIPTAEEISRPQKVNVNTAEAWLLEALPQIGPVRAQAIIAYRNQHGPFHLIDDLTKVEGIGHSTLEKIEDLITVG